MRNRKKYILWMPVLAYLLAGIDYWQRARNAQIGGLYEMVYRMTDGMQMRSVLGCMGLFLTGLILIHIIRTDIDDKWVFLLAYPTGISLWCLVGGGILIIGVPFNLPTMMVGLIGCLICIWGIRRPDKQTFSAWNIVWHTYLFSGVAVFASTGIMFTFTSHDYYYFFDNLGKALVIRGGMSAEFSTFLTSTGIAPALLSALAYMIHWDNIYALHHCLSFCFLGIFALGIYRHARKHPFLKSAAITLFLLLNSPFWILNGWIISNTYNMFLLFIICGICFQYKDRDRIPADFSSLLTLMICALTLFRSDSGILLCCLFVALAETSLRSRIIVRRCILPSFFLLLIYYAKLFYLLRDGVDGMYLNWKTIGMILLLYIGTIVYYYVVRNRFQLVKRYYRKIVAACFLTLNVFMAVFLQELFWKNLRNILYNIFTPSEFWGTTGIFLIVIAIGILAGKSVNIWLFAAFVMAVTYIDVGVLRGFLIGVARQGFGDSFNRLLVSLLPIVFFGAYLAYENHPEQLSDYT